MTRSSQGYLGTRITKIATSCLLIATIFVSLGLPEKAAAQAGFVPTFETIISPVSISASSYIARKGFAGTGGLDAIGWLVAKVLIKSITRSTVAWINSGFRGNPAYVQNPQAFLLDIADQEIGSFIQGGDLSFLCSPFQLQVKRQLLLSTRGSFGRKSQCTLTRVVRNFDDFVSGTERTLGSAGGWSGWFAMAQTQNNPYGAYAIAQAELELRIGQKSLLELKLLDWGKGFLSWRDCSGVPATRRANDLDDSNCPIATPGSVIAGTLEDTLGSSVRQLELADEFNEIISALAVQLTSQVLGSAGLTGLSQSRNGSPSYLSQLGDDVIVDGRAALTNEIGIALAPEREYLDSKSQALSRVGASENLVNSVISCYRQALVSTSTTLTPEERTTALGEITAASSTLLSAINPLKSTLSQAASSSASNIASLTSLRARASSIASLTELESLRSEYSRLVGRLHNGTDAGLAREEYTNTISPQMATLDQATNAKLTACRAFPPRETIQ